MFGSEPQACFYLSSPPVLQPLLQQLLLWWKRLQFQKSLDLDNRLRLGSMTRGSLEKPDVLGLYLTDHSEFQLQQSFQVPLC